MSCFCLDIETLATSSESVILSLGMVYFDDQMPLTYQGLIDNSIFIKFDSKEQVTKYKRRMSKDTLDWWKKQGTRVQETNLLPSKNDMSAEEGLNVLRRWFESKPNAKDLWVWTRGQMDQGAFESLCRDVGQEIFVPYNQYRDVRTALDCFYEKTKNGYLEVDTAKVPDWDWDNVMKHHPCHDSAADLCMLFGGKA